VPRLALATSSKYRNLTVDDRLLLAPLAESGIVAEPAIWNDEQYPWTSCSAVVIRSCWDYHLVPEKFLAWIAKLEAARIPLLNPAPVIRWNIDKYYLGTLEAKGIRIIPTLWAEDRPSIRLKEKLHELGWHKAVIKPRISATAHRTEIVTAENADAAQPLFDDLHRGPGVMLQKFIDGIAAEGEWSLMFFAGEFNHAVLKRPKPGDFRVQSDYGGTAHALDPPRHVLESAAHAVQAIAPTVYARVDGVVDDGLFWLMELELIEPALFLAEHPLAPKRFADAVVQALAAETG
jgi:glutathione synthase/RimK-type ligase-like ATP-grasp enzyme